MMMRPLEGAELQPSCLPHGESCELYCFTCKIPVCYKCLFHQHRTHVVEQQEVVTRAKLEKGEKMKTDAENLHRELVKQFHDQSDKALEEMKDIFRENLEELEVQCVLPEVVDEDSLMAVARTLELLQSARIEQESLQNQQGVTKMTFPRIVLKNGENPKLQMNPKLNQADTEVDASKLLMEGNPVGEETAIMRSSDSSMEIQGSNGSSFDVEAKVLYVESPDRIYVREVSQQKQYDKMRVVLSNTELSSEYSNTGQIKVDSLVVCRPGDRRVMERGHVMGVEGDTFRVRLMDIGRIENIHKSEVRLMGEEMEEFGCMTRCVGLAGIEPTGGTQGKWSLESVWTLEEIIEEEVVRIRRSEGERNLVEIFVEKLTVLGPMEPGKKKTVSVSNYLRKKGLACMKGTSVACLKEADFSVQEKVTGILTAEGEEELKRITRSVSDVVGDLEEGQKTVQDSEEGSSLSSALSPPRSPNDEIIVRLPGEPKVPAEKVFRAKLTNIDFHGTVWVVPKDTYKLKEDVMDLINRSSISCTEYDVKVGDMVVMRSQNCRGRITDISDGAITLLDIDTGKRFTDHRIRSFTLPAPTLKDIPPLAIPLKLYGVMKARQLDEDLEDLLSENVSVHILAINSQIFPLTANVRISKNNNNSFDGNLALDLLERGSFKLIRSLQDWMNEYLDHGLDKELDPSVKFVSGRIGCSDYWSRVTETPDVISLLNIGSLPHPFPLAAGQWIYVTMEGVTSPLVDCDEKKPTVETTNSSQVWCSIQPIPSGITSNQDDQVEAIEASARIHNQDLMSLEKEFQGFAEELQVKHTQARAVDKIHIGQSVLAFYEEDGMAGEWSRATVRCINKDSGKLTVFFTDFGHIWHVDRVKVRLLTKEQLMEPYHVRDLHFKMPEEDNRLLEIRSSLMDTYLVMARVEAVKLVGDVEKVEVSFWSICENGTLIKKIC